MFVVYTQFTTVFTGRREQPGGPRVGDKLTTHKALSVIQHSGEQKGARSIEKQG